MGKIFRAMSAPLDENMADNGTKYLFDPRAWKQLENGDYVNIHTGEVREADDFDFELSAEVSDLFTDKWEDVEPSSPDGRISAADIVRTMKERRSIGKRSE